jgi:hypothetical protein
MGNKLGADEFEEIKNGTTTGNTGNAPVNLAPQELTV